MSLSDLLQELEGLAGAPDSQWSSMPPAAYRSPELFGLEAEHLFYGGWVLVGRVDQVPSAGDYLCFDVLEEPVVVTRDKRGELHVLSRICRHRWMEVCTGQGSAGALVCPYHAWTYELDGRLRHAPEMDKTPGFDVASIRLPEIRSEVWEGFIFVNISGDAEPLSETLGAAREQLRGYRLEDWVTVRSLDLGVSEWDWKIFMDNGEIYHHLMLHRETVEPRSPANLAITGARADGWFLLYGPRCAGDPDRGERRQARDAELSRAGRGLGAEPAVGPAKNQRRLLLPLPELRDRALGQSRDLLPGEPARQRAAATSGSTTWCPESSRTTRISRRLSTKRSQASVRFTWRTPPPARQCSARCTHASPVPDH